MTDQPTARRVTWGDLIEVERRLGPAAFESHQQEAVGIIAWRASGSDLGLMEWLDSVPVEEMGDRVRAVTGELDRVETDPEDETGDPTPAAASSGTSPLSAGSGA